MTTDLSQFIQQTPIIDTHEHMAMEAGFLAGSPGRALISARR
jgi:hypothetical protein